VQSASLTRLPAEVPLMVMDTAPAAVLGALLDPHVAKADHQVIANVGNFHTLAFRLGNNGVEGVFEHHTGHLDVAKLDDLLRGLADSTLQHEDVFGDHGHGALVYNPDPIRPEFITVTGPRRAMMNKSAFPTYFAVPYGDMMIAGCFGLVRAWADVMQSEEVLDSLYKEKPTGAPWDSLF
jgi:uncharacterized protein (DUF1786 family)